MRYEDFLRALSEAGARYLIVGGAAVIAHGVPRFTADLDILVDTAENSLRALIAVAKQMGLRPRAPVPMEDLADAEKRRQGREEKGMLTFSLFDPGPSAREVDVMLSDPAEFEALYARHEPREFLGILVPLIALDDLIAMKKKAGRPQDLKDAEYLEMVKRARER